MGYDVTFHPISRGDLQRYVFDVIERPDLALSRADAITRDPARRRAIERIYEQFPAWVAELRQGEPVALRSTFAVAAAQLAGFLHPYWYARNAAIGWLGDDTLNELCVGLDRLDDAPACLRKTDSSAAIAENYTASGFIHDVAALERRLIVLARIRPKSPLFEVFDDRNLASLRAAIEYCKEHDLGLIEATDVIVPVVDEAATDPENYREAPPFEDAETSGTAWYERPKPAASESALRKYTESRQALQGDTVVVRRLWGRNPTAVVVPYYLVPGHERRPGVHRYRYTAVLYEDGALQLVHNFRVKLKQRSTEHRPYWRRLLDHEREFYEQDSAENPAPEIERGGWAQGYITYRILPSLMMAARAGDRLLTDRYLQKLRLSADAMLRNDNVKSGEKSHAEALRARVMSDALLDKALDRDGLIEACKSYLDHSRTIERSRWNDLDQMEYAEFALTAMLAGAPEVTLTMLRTKRPFDQQQELVDLYQSVAMIYSSQTDRQEAMARTREYLDFLRRPGLTLHVPPLTPLMLAGVLRQLGGESRDELRLREALYELGR